MANLQIKNIDDELYAQIKHLAALENRSVSQEVLFLVKDYLAKGGTLSAAKTPARVLLGLSGSWEDERSAEEIAREIRSGRKNSCKPRRGM
jgi:plasmid stability protein